MLKELRTIEFLRPYFGIKSINNINDLHDFFMKIQRNNDFNSFYVLNFLHNFICKKEVYKTKSSAEYFEYFFGAMFGGEIADTTKRKNLNYEVPDFFVNVKDKIASNKREKADIIFSDNYAISLKTLILDNLELNLGSFEKKVLFDGFGLNTFLSERKSESGVGLGSVAQLSNLLSILKNNKKLDIFYDKFKKMIKFIFSHDLILAIKNDVSLDFYFFSGDEIYNIFSSFCDDINLVKIVNRYEGNSIRINRNILLEKCSKKVILKFDKLNGSILELINEFDEKLHKNYARFFNGDSNAYKEIKNDLDILFKEFNKRIWKWIK